jgi:hypothetical protein
MAAAQNGRTLPGAADVVLRQYEEDMQALKVGAGGCEVHLFSKELPFHCGSTSTSSTTKAKTPCFVNSTLLTQVRLAQLEGVIASRDAALRDLQGQLAACKANAHAVVLAPQPHPPTPPRDTHSEEVIRALRQQLTDLTAQLHALQQQQQPRSCAHQPALQVLQASCAKLRETRRQVSIELAQLKASALSAELWDAVERLATLKVRACACVRVCCIVLYTFPTYLTPDARDFTP